MDVVDKGKILNKTKTKTKRGRKSNALVEVYLECTNHSQRLDKTVYETTKGKQSMGRRTNGRPIADKGKILKS